MTYKIIGKYIKNLDFKIPKPKIYYSLSNVIKEYECCSYFKKNNKEVLLEQNWANVWRGFPINPKNSYSLHIFLIRFLFKCLFSILGKSKYKWTNIDFFVISIASLIPFGTFYVDKQYLKKLVN